MEPDAVAATDSCAGVLRSRLADWPTPAVPLNALVNALRAGSADGLLVVRLDSAAAGAAIATGEAAKSADRNVRVGELVGRDVGVIVGTSEEVARLDGARASCVLGDWVGTSIARGELLFEVACDVCRATADDDGAGEGLFD